MEMITEEMGIAELSGAGWKQRCTVVAISISHTELCIKNWCYHGGGYQYQPHRTVHQKLVPLPLWAHLWAGAERDPFGHDFLCGRKIDHEHPEAFSTEDPKSSCCRCGHSQLWMLRSPAIFTNTDLSWQSCIDYVAVPLPDAVLLHPTQLEPLYPSVSDSLLLNPVNKVWRRW